MNPDGLLVGASFLAVSPAPGRLMRLAAAKLRHVELESQAPVTDRSGRPVAYVRPVEVSGRRKAALLAADIVIPDVIGVMLPGAGGYRLQVVDPAGDLIFAVDCGRGSIDVRDGNGDAVGTVRPIARTIREGSYLRFFRPDPDPPVVTSWKSWERLQVGRLAVCPVSRSLPAEYDIVDDGGVAVARLAVHEGGQKVVMEVQAPMGEPLRSLVVAYLCSLADGRWTKWWRSD